MSETENKTAESAEIEIIVIDKKTFSFILPNANEIETDISYWFDDNGVLHGEAWLHPKEYIAMKFLGDVFEVSADDAMTDEEITQYLINVFGSSETFQESVKAVLSDQIEYFVFDGDGEENGKDD
ncbi:MAG: hypothetical protein NC452_05740 [Eubacterium sp.]|nr:hypothetical protein [Eubacterium sp.]